MSEEQKQLLEEIIGDLQWWLYARDHTMTEGAEHLLTKYQHKLAGKDIDAPTKESE